MRTPKRALFSGRFLLLATLCAFGAQGNEPQDTLHGQTKTVNTEKSCQQFVQSFYNWYVPKSLKARKEPASNLALKYKGFTFSRELYRALQEDSDAQARVAGKGEIVGIDFDPFLFSQDPCDQYVAGSVTRKGESYWVDVYGICSGKKSATPDVVPEVRFKDGRWYFVDFHNVKSGHTGDGSLLSGLKEARENREKAGGPSSHP